MLNVCFARMKVILPYCQISTSIQIKEGGQTHPDLKLIQAITHQFDVGCQETH